MKKNNISLNQKADTSRTVNGDFINSPKSIGVWAPRAEIMSFLNYGDTAMTTLENSGEIIVTKIGRRKFINTQSLIDYLEKNVLKGGSK